MSRYPISLDMTPDIATAYCALVHRKTTGCGDDFPCSRRFLHAHAWRYASVSNGCQEGTLRDGVVPQKTLLSFTDVPKLQTVTPLKSQKREVIETAASAVSIRGMYPSKGYRPLRGRETALLTATISPMLLEGLSAFPEASATLVSLSAEYPHRRRLAPPPIAARR